MYKLNGFPGKQLAIKLYQRHLIAKAQNNPVYRQGVISQLRDGVIRFAQLFAPENKRELRKNILLFETFAHDPLVFEPLLKDPLVIKHLAETRAVWQEIGIQMEKDSAQDLLSGKPGLVDDIIAAHYGYVQREGLAAGINKNSKVLLMGGGALPLTAIALHKYFGASCTCLDIDPQAIELSRQVVARLGLESAIHIEQANALDHAIEDYDLIIVTAHCMPKEAVFSKIAKQAKPGVRVIYREPVGLHKLLYYENPDAAAYGFTKARVLSPKKGGMVESVVMVKQLEPSLFIRPAGYFPDSRMEVVDIRLKNGESKTLRFEIFPCQYQDGHPAWESLRDAIVAQSRTIFKDFVDDPNPGYDSKMVEDTLKETGDGLVGVIWDQERFIGLSVVGWLKTDFGRTLHLMLSQLDREYRISKIIPYSLLRLDDELLNNQGVRLWQEAMVSYDSPSPFVLGNLSAIMRDPYPDPRKPGKRPGPQQKQIGKALAAILFPGFQFDADLFVVKAWYKDLPGMIYAPKKVPRHKEKPVNDFCAARLKYEQQNGDKFLGLGKRMRMFTHIYYKWLHYFLNVREL